jgi:hypothetical protein
MEQVIKSNQKIKGLLITPQKQESISYYRSIDLTPGIACGSYIIAMKLAVA